MNYPQSKQILKEINNAKKILINCHRGPDPDSIGSSLALSNIVNKLGKTPVIICPSDIPSDLKFLKGAENINKVDYSSFDFTDYDLFLVIDSASYSMVSGSNDLRQPDIPIIVLDHHISNTGFGFINLIDASTTSTAELLCKIFEDWKIKIDSDTAESLLTGIIGDTGSFQYQNVGKETFIIASNLIEYGANKDKIIYNVYRNVSLGEIKIWGKIIENMQIDEKNHFVWSVITVNDCKNYVGSDSAKEDAANLFFPIVKNTDFGIIMEEKDNGMLSVSFRSRSDFDVSKIAGELGGGGHKAAAGARIESMEFNDAVEKVLKAARKYANKTS